MAFDTIILYLVQVPYVARVPVILHVFAHARLTPSPPPALPDFHYSHHVQSRALACAASLEAVPLEDLAETMTISGKTDGEASELLQEANAFSNGVKTSARDALMRGLGRRGWAQRASAVTAGAGGDAARPGVAFAQVCLFLPGRKWAWSRFRGGRGGGGGGGSNRAELVHLQHRQTEEYHQDFYKSF